MLASVKQSRARATYRQLDVRDLVATRDVLRETARNEGLDVVVNNAGFALPKTIFESTPGDFSLLFDLNVMALYVSMQAASELMRETGGSIINIGSTAATRVLPNRSLYCGTKGAVLQMTKAVAP